MEMDGNIILFYWLLNRLITTAYIFPLKEEKSFFL